jgi:hypothetical protein
MMSPLHAVLHNNLAFTMSCFVLIAPLAIGAEMPKPSSRISLSAALACNVRNHTAQVVEFAPSAGLLAVVSRAPNHWHLTVVDLSNGLTKRSVHGDRDIPSELFWSWDNDIVVLSSDTSVELVHLTEGRDCTIPRRDHSVGFIDSPQLYIEDVPGSGGSNGNLEFYDAECRLQETRTALAPYVRVLPGGHRLAFMNGLRVVLTDQHLEKIREITLNPATTDQKMQKLLIEGSANAWMPPWDVYFPASESTLCGHVIVRGTAQNHCYDLESGASVGRLPKGAKIMGASAASSRLLLAAKAAYGLDDFVGGLESTVTIGAIVNVRSLRWSVWDYRTGSKILQVERQQVGRPLALSPNGDQLAVVRDDSVELYDCR